jgi:hypothetical protein
MLRAGAWLAIGAGLGFVLALRVRPAVDSSCCERVAVGARDKVGALCGSWGGTCQELGDSINLWPHIPSLLDAFGVSP